MGDGVHSVLDVGYDPERQRAEVLASRGGLAGIELPSAELRRALLGRMRWQVIYGENVFLPYSFLLDGAFFSALGPDELLEALIAHGAHTSPVLPFVVNTRDHDLAGALQRMLSGGFLFASLPLDTETRHALRDQLRAVATEERLADEVAAEGHVVPVAARVLEECPALPDDVRRRALSRWQRWLDAERAGQLKVVPSRGAADYERAYADHPVPQDGELLTDAGRDVVRAWVAREIDVQGLPNRTALYGLLKPLAESDHAGERADAVLIRDRFDLAYNSAIAFGEKAGIRYDDRHVRRDVTRREVKQAPAHEVAFPDQFELRLGDLSAGEWQVFTAACADELRTWWRGGGDAPQALQEIGDRLRRETAGFEVAARPLPPWRVRMMNGASVAVVGASSYAGSFGGHAGALGVPVATVLLGAAVRKVVDGPLRELRERSDLVTLTDRPVPTAD